MKTRINGLQFVFFDFLNTKNAQKYQNFYLATQMEHDQSSYFCRGLDDFCWGPAPAGPTLVTGLSRSLAAADETLLADQKSSCVAVAM